MPGTICVTPWRPENEAKQMKAEGMTGTGSRLQACGDAAAAEVATVHVIAFFARRVLTEGDNGPR